METFVPTGNIHGPILPEFVIPLEIPAGAKLLYALLCRHSFRKDHCWPSCASLAQRLGCSINSIKSWLRELARVKLITVQEMPGRSSNYFILKPPVEMIEAAKMIFQGQNIGHENMPTQPDFDATQPDSDRSEPNFGYIKDLKKENNENTMPQQPNPVISEAGRHAVQCGGGGNSFSDFEKVLAAYPRKEAIGMARTAWKTLLRDALLPPVAKILEAIERFKAGKDWQRENGRYIPYLANFLKGERWNDPFTETEIQENNAKEASEKARRKREQEEEQRRTENEERKAVHKPDFDAFAARFKDNFHIPMVFGLWMYFRDKGIAPLASDVPEDNKLGIMDFIKSFANHVRQATQSIMPHEKDCKNPTSHLVNKFESSNSIKPKHSGAIGDVFETAGEILTNSPLFMGLKADQPKLGRAIAC